MQRSGMTAIQPTESAVTNKFGPFFLAMGLALVAGATPTAAFSQPAPLCDDPIAASQEPRLKGSIVKVSDGDTIHFLTDETNLSGTSQGTGDSQASGPVRLKVRMTGMDTPELHLPVPGGIASQGYWAEQAWHRLEELLPIGDRAELVDYGKDHYGRTLGRVYHQGKDVHVTMIAEGLAALYLICSGPSCNANFYKVNKVKEYVEACRVAVDGDLGIFEPTSGLDELPFEFRLRKQKREADKWIGDMTTKRLYPPREYNRVPVCDRLFFPVRAEAEALGYQLQE